jgi:flagellar M-ring protein FliF
MPDFISRVMENLASMSTRKKLALFGAFAGAIAAIFAVFLWVELPKMELLYSNLASDDVQAIIDKLKAENIPHEVSEDKTAIFVPSEKVAAVRLKLAEEGLPGKPGVGFEIFDKTTIGVTEFVQELNYRRALEGELARTIKQLSVLRDARVHIVMPKKTLFVEQQEKARASVVVSLRAGKHLNDNQLEGIKHLVASAVSGLDANLVTIVDSNGRLLSRPEESDTQIAASNSQLEHKNVMEKGLEQKIQTMLEQVVGMDKATVRVAAVLNFDQVEQMEEKFDPEVQVPRSEQLGEEKVVMSSESTEAPPGVASNLPRGVQPEPARVTSQSETTKNDGVTNYEINKVTTRTIGAPGAIKQLSVAVIVDGTYATGAGPDGKVARNYVARTPDEMLKLETIVKNAMGFSDDRGDEVSVVNIPFETGPLMPEPGFNIGEWMPLIRYAIGLGLVLFLFFFVVRPIMKALLYVPPPPSPEELLQATARPQLEEKEEEPEPEPEAEPAPIAEPELAPVLEAPIEPDLEAETPPSVSQLSQQVLELAKQDPKMAADMLKQMIRGRG